MSCMAIVGFVRFLLGVESFGEFGANQKSERRRATLTQVGRRGLASIFGLQLDSTGALQARVLAVSV
jgi:hypothetical protein